MSDKKSYKQLKQELDEIISQLDGELDDLDKAIGLYEQGQKIIGRIEKYLENTKIKIEMAQDKNQPKHK